MKLTEDEKRLLDLVNQGSEITIFKWGKFNEDKKIKDFVSQIGEPTRKEGTDLDYHSYHAHGEIDGKRVELYGIVKGESIS